MLHRVIRLFASAALLLFPLFARAEGPATKPVAAPASHPSILPANRFVAPLSLPPLEKPLPSVPASVADLKAIEKRVEDVGKKVLPSVVGVIVGGGQGSGVIVSADGYVLTAAHVSGEPNIDVVLVMPNGRKVKAKTLGVNKLIDSGLIKITEPGDWPYVEIGKSASLTKGQWVMALGHPGGYQTNRPPVLRLGRVLFSKGSDDFITTDCTLVGGDSGGPLFDLDGKVVGIHSRIGASTLSNMHVPADTFTETWDRLARAESWNEPFAFITPRGPMLGIGGEDAAGKGGAKITDLTSGGPAEKAGLKPNDVVTSFDGKPVTSLDDLGALIGKHKSGDQVPMEVKRDGKTVEVKVTLSRRPRN